MALPGVFPEVAVIERSQESAGMAETNEDAIAGARAALDGFMAAFNREDTEAIRTRWFHFPHVRFHSGKVTVMATPAEYHNLVWARHGQSADWGRSAWDYQEVMDAGPEKVHFRVQFTRYRADGTPIGSYRSLYIVTLQNGRWGITARSSWAE
jgi:hypothetical protein